MPVFSLCYSVMKRLFVFCFSSASCQLKKNIVERSFRYNCWKLELLSTQMSATMNFSALLFLVKISRFRMTGKVSIIEINCLFVLHAYVKHYIFFKLNYFTVEEFYAKKNNLVNILKKY
uniref:(northern house mosquito) hypothetical protein n=1 Tax=Culex pipiens TaxID=7175 RepID=A0A8D8K690_CULPI